MNRTNLIVHPYIRLAAASLAVAGIVITNNLYQLLIGWICIAIPLSIGAKLVKRHINLLLYAILPMFLLLLTVYAFLLPMFQPGHETSQGLKFALQTALKLILYTSVFQLLLSIPSNELHSTLRFWGIKGEGLVIYLGALTVWVDVKIKANKIVDARFARGLVKNRSFFTRIKQVPYVVRPLISCILISAVERSYSWKQKKILARVENLQATDFEYSLTINTLLLLVSLFWLLTSVYVRFK